MLLVAGTIGLVTLMQQPQDCGVARPEAAREAAMTQPAHPLALVATRILDGTAGEQPAWKLPMVLNGLRKEALTARCTTYCELCPDGGGTGTRWGTRIRRGIVAADPRYWGPGSVVYVGPPVDEVLIVEDTGSAIRGPNRFDVCVTGHHALCRKWGSFKATYVPLYRTDPARRWGTKPTGWHPPEWGLTRDLLALAADRVPGMQVAIQTLMAQIPADPLTG